MGDSARSDVGRFAPLVRRALIPFAKTPDSFRESIAKDTAGEQVLRYALVLPPVPLRLYQKAALKQ